MERDADKDREQHGGIMRVRSRLWASRGWVLPYTAVPKASLCGKISSSWGAADGLYPSPKYLVAELA